MKSPEFAKRPETLLPLITKETIDGIEGEFADRAHMFSDVYQRLLLEQPVLTNQMANFIVMLSQDTDEAKKMLQVFTLTYRLLESQSEADHLSGLVE